MYKVILRRVEHKLEWEVWEFSRVVPMQAPQDPPLDPPLGAICDYSHHCHLHIHWNLNIIIIINRILQQWNYYTTKYKEIQFSN